MEISGKTAIVTGGAVRIGREIILELAEAGANVICQYYSSEPEAEDLKNKVEAMGSKIELFQLDLNEEEAPLQMVQKALDAFGSIDILINNSAVFYPTPLNKITEKDWDTFINLNLKAAFFLAKELGLIMKSQGEGRIVNIGDTSYKSPWVEYLPYTISKAGINTMTKGLAKSLAPEVLVNCINPGPVLLPENYSGEQAKKAVERTLLKRVGDPKDIARTVRFLVESEYITGASIPVDGGRHLG
jgi:NAD(P)-dependent dehydrogenase (short-subunit alcohol dehydrogenase family)